MFVCVLRSGGQYTPWHVERLQQQLNRPLHCLTDVSLGTLPEVTSEPLKHGYKGWWSKIELFRLDGPLVYLDLDVDIIGNPNKLYRDEFTMWGDPLYPDYFNSSVMSWKDTPKHVFDNFDESLCKRYKRFPKGGDQGYIQDQVKGIKAFEKGLITSYRAGSILENTIVVAYHGRPKPWDLK